ncbi:MAG TPA: glycosyltransferase [Solirubrobacteraceae bacterium]
MRISVALAVRNGERYLPALLDSLARQTAPPHELVVTEDASDDATPRVLEDFAARAPFPVRVRRYEENLGHVEGFVRAAQRCEGDAVAFCDADDVWVDHKLELCGRELEATGASIVMHSTRVVDQDLEYLGYDWPRIAETRLVPPLGLTAVDVDAPGMAMLFRHDVLSLGEFETRPLSRYGSDRRMMQDEWVLFLAGAVGPVRLLADTLLLYRQHGENYCGPVERRRQLTLRPETADYGNQAEHFAACADYLETCSSPDPAVRERLAEASRHYRRTAENWALRTELYEAADRRRRARVLRDLVSGRAYGERTAGGFGRAALGKDLVAGVALGVRPAPER